MVSDIVDTIDEAIDDAAEVLDIKDDRGNISLQRAITGAVAISAGIPGGMLEDVVEELFNDWAD